MNFLSDRMQYLQTSNIAQCKIECPSGCTCEKTTVICRRLQLQQIPNDIPVFTTELWEILLIFENSWYWINWFRDLQDNSIKRITRDGSLQRLKNLRILYVFIKVFLLLNIQVFFFK